MNFDKVVRGFKSFWLELAIFFFSFLIRLPALGRDVFNADAFRWKSRIDAFCGGLFGGDLAQTAQVPHPGVTLMWLGTLGVKLRSLWYILFPHDPPVESELVFEIHFFQKLMVVLAVAFLLALMFRLLKNLFDGFGGLEGADLHKVRPQTTQAAAFLAVLLLTVEPFFYAHSRALHLDVLQTMFGVVGILYLLKYPNTAAPSLADLKPLVLSAVFVALACLTKSTALFLLPFVGLILILFAICPPAQAGKVGPESGKGRISLNPPAGGQKIRPRFGSDLKSLVTLLLCYFVTVLLAFAILWPAVWVQPLQTLSLYFSGIISEGFAGHEHTYFGRETLNPGWTFYLVVLGIRLSPWLLGLGVAGVMGGIREMWRIGSRGGGYSNILKNIRVLSVLFVLLYLAFISVPTKKLDRYILPTIPFLAILGGVGLARHLDRILPGKGDPIFSAGPALRKIAVAAVLVVAFFSLKPYYPDFLGYYSPLVGGLRAGPYIIKPSWMPGARWAGEYFNSFPNASELKVATPDSGQFRPFFKMEMGDTKYWEQREGSDYLLVSPWVDEEKYRDRQQIELVETLYLGQAPVYNVFKVMEEH